MSLIAPFMTAGDLRTKQSDDRAVIAAMKAGIDQATTDNKTTLIIEEIYDYIINDIQTVISNTTDTLYDVYFNPFSLLRITSENIVAKSTYNIEQIFNKKDFVDEHISDIIDNVITFLTGNGYTCVLDGTKLTVSW
jgi:hypothetical protein